MQAQSEIYPTTTLAGPADPSANSEVIPPLADVCADHESMPDSPPGKPGKWEPMPEVSDEFLGDKLDETKWQPCNPTWLGRAPGWFNPDNVSVGDTCLKLKSKVEDPPADYPEDYHTFSTAFVRSKAMVKYGYFEATVWPADSVTSSSFWFVRNDAQDWNEIDIFELSTAEGFDKMYNMNAHLFRENGVTLDPQKSYPEKVSLDFRVCTKFKVGLEWDEDKVEWSIDGKVVRTLKNHHWQKAMWVQFDSETMGDWFGIPDVDDPRLPATFRIFNIRSWRKISD